MRQRSFNQWLFPISLVRVTVPERFASLNATQAGAARRALPVLLRNAIKVLMPAQEQPLAIHGR